MYLDFYRMSKAPFQTTPDPGFFYMSPAHREALAAIMYGIQQRKGFLAVTGEVGVGKTTVLRTYLSQAGSPKDKTIYLLNPNLTFPELLTSVLRELDVDPRGLHEAAMVDVLHERLVFEYQAGRNVVLLVDEAQNVPLKTLELLRMLSNLETATDKLLQIVLVGQPELDELLQLQSLRQLNQRIAVKARIRTLTEKESAEYVAHRLAQAGVTRGWIFNDEALRLIVRYGEGIPRRINVICDNALITGLGYQAMPVSGKIVREVLRDMDGGRSWKNWRLWWPIAS
jgi:general secretion pathway protein A